MADLTATLAETRERHALLAKLLAERSAVADQARALLAQGSTYPRKRREVEAELQAAEMDLGWIGSELHQLAGRIRMLEADLGQLMAQDVEFKAAEARGAKATNRKAGATADAREEDPASARA